MSLQRYAIHAHSFYQGYFAYSDKIEQLVITGQLLSLEILPSFEKSALFVNLWKEESKKVDTTKDEFPDALVSCRVRSSDRIIYKLYC